MSAAMSAAMSALTLARMSVEDIPAVSAIDQLSFPLPWSVSSYHHELTKNPAAYWWVARLASDLIGYTGYWFIVDEIHLSTVAVHPQWRRQGVGAQLLRRVLRDALEVNATLVTLEVRVGNRAAQDLYYQHGFVQVGRRKRYYRDNHEDALLLTLYLDTARRAELLETFTLHLTQDLT